MFEAEATVRDKSIEIVNSAILIAVDNEGAAISKWTIQDAMKPGISAVVSHWKPFLLIQAMALLCVVAYYKSQAFANVAGVLQDWKVAGGLTFAFLAGALAGGLVPEMARMATGMVEGSGWQRWHQVLWTSLVFGVVGVFIDLFYKLQALLFGTGIDPATLAYKTAFDMFVFAAFFCIPFEVASLQWPQKGYRPIEFIKGFGAATYRDNVLPVLLPCWAFWIPVLACVYAMPMNLQFVFAIFAEAAWSIIVVYVATRSGAAEVPADCSSDLQV